MNDYRYQYDNSRPRKKFICPSCGKKGVFTRYIDTQSRDYLPEQYGICDRVNSCDYSLNPYKDGYSKMIWESETKNKKFVLGPAYSTSATSKTDFKYHLTEKQPSFIPAEVLKDT